jgi:hypothetical protein
MSDFDTRRVGEIATLEMKLKHALTQSEEYKATAERWEPKFTTEATTDSVKFGVSFGGKRAPATYPLKGFVGAEATSATTEVLTTLFNSMMIDQLRPLLAPEVQRMIDAANANQRVGKW